MNLIKMINVEKTYKTGVTAIYDLNLTIEKGEFVFVIGATGCGKSTLIKMLYREERPTSGTINIGGINVSKLRNRNVYKIRRKIGVVFQDFKLLPKSTVYENVALMKDIKDDILNPITILERVGLKNHVKKFPNQLSGGEQQRVSIARAITKNPEILLCDEPTGALDSETGCKVLQLIQDVCREFQKTVIIVTHNSNIAKVADKVIRLKNGKILEISLNDSPADIKEVEW